MHTHLFKKNSQNPLSFFKLSDLESEMYQLSHILAQQRNLLSSLRDETLLGDQKNVIDEKETGENEQDQNKKAISIIKEALTGYEGNLDNKIFLHEGGLIELSNENNYRPICRCHLFLFNDVLLVSKIKHDKFVD